MMDFIWRLTHRVGSAEWMAEWREATRWDALARYNSERYRGVAHTIEKIVEMEAEQQAFDTQPEVIRQRRYKAARRVGYR